MVETAIQTANFVKGLQCPRCSATYPADQVQTFATCCNQPLSVTYEFPVLSKKILSNQPYSMWRYAAFLPVMNAENIISLGEGWTPLRPLDRLSAKYGVDRLLIKDESMNPTGSFKARGLSVAVSKAKELGISHCIIPTAGNAGGALSAYAAKAGIRATVVMPRITPSALKEECRLYGAELILVDGLIDACGKKARELAAKTDAFDMSTMKEPYRLEGKKTLGYEIAEQLNWQLPDVIIYPTGGGTGLIGMWKAFREMKALGWLKGKMPKMIIVQSEKCNPMIQMFETGIFPADFAAAPSIAYGLAVPHPFAKDLIQQVLHESGGTAITVSEPEMLEAMEEVAITEGLLLSPEGAASYMGLKKLAEKNHIHEDASVLLFNTGAWHKYR